MSYQIKRECWNEKTYNGYTDNPYWRVDTKGMSFGLNDNGEYWVIGPQVDEHPQWFKEDLEKIVSECNLSIKSIYQFNAPTTFTPKYPCLMIWDTPNVLKTLVFFYSKDNGICVYTEDPNFHSLIGVKYDWDIMDFEEFTPSEY